MVAVVLLAAYDTRPPTTFNPNARCGGPPSGRSRDAAEAASRARRGRSTAKGPLIETPFSAIQVQAWVHEGRLVDVKTLYLTGSDAHTNALNKRAEPILRREALAAGGADIDTVTGATYTSEAWSSRCRRRSRLRVSTEHRSWGCR